MPRKVLYVSMISLALVAGAAFLGAVGYLLIQPLVAQHTFENSPEEWSEVRVGMSKEEVVEKLGKPIKIYRRQKGETTIKRRLTGYGPSERVEAQAIYAYATGAQVYYIFFDEDDKVVGWSLNGT
jgi:hypothetical protein